MPVELSPVVVTASSGRSTGVGDMPALVRTTSRMTRGACSISVVRSVFTSGSVGVRTVTVAESVM